MSYPTPARRNIAELVIKKSRFIAWADIAPDRDAAMALVSEAREQYPDAGHHCWAYLLGAPQSPASAAMSDDGEPSGTAGKPILNVLQHKDIGDVAIVVIRYFGGIKLGAGGLVRAYSGAAQSAMETLAVEEHVDMLTYHLRAGFEDEQFLRYWLELHAGRVVNMDWKDGIECTLEVPADQKTTLDALVLERRWQSDEDDR